MLREVVYTAEVKIEGITPMLLHKPAGIGDKPGTRKADVDYSEEWKLTVYTNQAGEIALPSMLIEAMLRDAGKGMKVGKNFMTKVVPTGISVVEYEVLVLCNDRPITVKDIEKNNWLFACSAVVKKSRILRIRAAVPIGWTMEFSIDVLDGRLSKGVVKDLVETAGYSAGLCDWRPGAPKPGKFGQFELVKFE